MNTLYIWKNLVFVNFNLTNLTILTHRKQKSYFPKVTSLRRPPFHSRHSASLLGTSPIVLWSIYTGIRATFCWIRCFDSWTVWDAGAMMTWDFRYPQRKKSHAEWSVDLAGHVMSPYLNTGIIWLRKQIAHNCHGISCGVARSSILLERKKLFFGYWMTSNRRT
jgi:hypothetical protein